jgi:hypothetical protein
MTITDAPFNSDINWIKENTPPQSFFLNSSYLYHPASLAGRKIFLGWPYFPWAGGYDPQLRENLRKEIYLASDNNKNEICQLLKKNHLSFVTLGKNMEDFTPNLAFWQNNFLKVYNNPQNGFIIYDVSLSCQNVK